MTGFDERFEVSCSSCGVLGYRADLATALAYSKSAAVSHGQCEDVMVYDRMAHVGKPELYEPNGDVRSKRADG